MAIRLECITSKLDRRLSRCQRDMRRQLESLVIEIGIANVCGFRCVKRRIRLKFDGSGGETATFKLLMRKSQGLFRAPYQEDEPVVVGAGERVNSYGISNSDSLLLVPPSRTLSLADVFARDTISLGRPVKPTIGLKLEDDL